MVSIKKVSVAAMALAVCGAMFAGSVSAGTPGLDKRQQAQKERIKQGVKSGELTRKETKRLVRGQVELRRDERAAKADGEVTAAERIELQREANQQSRKIYRQKHDEQTRN
jgi:hypothetical protein